MVTMVGGQNRNEVRTNEQGVVVSIWRGPQNAETVTEVGRQIEEQLLALKAVGKKAMLLVDITAIRAADTSTEGRVAAKRLIDLPADATAIIGKGKMMAMAMFTLRFIKRKSVYRWFNNQRAGLNWLLADEKETGPRMAVSSAVAVIVALIGIMALIGWQTSNPYLTRLIPELRPINPLAAASLVMMGVGFMAYAVNNVRLLRITGGFGIAVGVASLLPLHVDTILFSNQLAHAGAHTNLADSAAICFIAMGITAFITTRTERWVLPVEYALTGLIVLLALFNVFGQLYAHDFIYGISDSFVMAFNLALAFLLAGGGLLLLIVYRQTGDILGLVSRSTWLIAAALLFVQVATFIGWDQSIRRNISDSGQEFDKKVQDINRSVDGRLQAYIDALHGFRGLYAASTTVSQGDFDAYYKALDLGGNYPGLRSMAYIAAVNDKDLPAFIKQRREDKSLNPGGNPTFTITSLSKDPVHYIATYVAVADSSQAQVNAALGTDVSSTPGRAAIYSSALASGDAYTSGTVTFRSTATSQSEKGFFITIPVKTAGMAGYSGLVNANFNYSGFFPKLFADKNLLSNLQVTVVDSDGGGTIYHANNMSSPAAQSREVTVPVINHKWRIAITAPANYGIHDSLREVQLSILVAGQIFSALLLWVFIIQGRARRQALDLAESMTHDLENERNMAVAKDQRSTAILESIGDAVFAVDNKERITLFNPAAQRISMVTDTQALGRPYKDVLHFEFEKDGSTNDSFIEQALGGRVTSMKNHTVLARQDGTKVAVADSAAPIYDAEHNLEGVIVVFRDVSKEQELDRAKTEFVSLASHQLRTPLSAINWYAEMLLNGDFGELNTDQKKQVIEIFQGNQRMVELVNSLLDVSRLDLGKLVNQPTPTAMDELAESVHKELLTSINQKSLSVTMDIADKLQPVIADPKLLRMIVQNLLSNAVKYTPEKGTVTFSLKPDDSRGQPQLLMTIADSGYGIPKAQQSKIFSKLFRADNVRALDVEGTGLGLYIVKQVVEKLGGSIRFESEEGKGTTFFVMIPFDTWTKGGKTTPTPSSIKES
jgi:PAS domain S-box-containing protein